MQLIGMLDSPFVRRVAVSAQLLGIPLQHLSLSVFRNYDDIRKVNPLVKVPTLVCDDGEVLVDSTLIIDYLESLPEAGPSLVPGADRRRALRIVGTALVAMEKTVQIFYETKQRPADKQYAPWASRVEQQLGEALRLLDAESADGWMCGDRIGQADISTAIAWGFTKLIRPDIAADEAYPRLAALAARAEALPEFLAWPIE